MPFKKRISKFFSQQTNFKLSQQKVFKPKKTISQPTQTIQSKLFFIKLFFLKIFRDKLITFFLREINSNFKFILIEETFNIGKYFTYEDK